MSVRLNKILNRFQKTVTELNALADSAAKEISQHDADIERLQKSRNDLSEERLQALGVANKITALIAA